MVRAVTTTAMIRPEATRPGPSSGIARRRASLQAPNGVGRVGSGDRAGSRAAARVGAPGACPASATSAADPA
jgi:hypothetical protein